MLTRNYFENMLYGKSCWYSIWYSEYKLSLFIDKRVYSLLLKKNITIVEVTYTFICVVFAGRGSTNTSVVQQKSSLKQFIPFRLCQRLSKKSKWKTWTLPSLWIFLIAKHLYCSYMSEKLFTIAYDESKDCGVRVDEQYV